ncbi:MAG: hypothetical protein IIU11_06630 [Bacteroidales bacterium]|jgi:sugar/nucleoside kinase (ribokinase family)|nr:hypothetical protein [Bacteroidales bacterium]MBR6279019.1 hypothetical protein [Bacteroidales bacterium]
MNKLAIAGSLAFDAIETPFGKREKIIGGATPYIALSASNFGVKPQIISVVGNDFTQEYFDVLHNKGIDTEGVKIDQNNKTMFWAGVYNTDMNQRKTLKTELNCFETFSPEVPQSYQEAEVLMLGNITPKIQQSVIKQFKKRPKLIVMDTMNFWMDIALQDLEETISMVDVLTINDEEAFQLSGEFVLLKAAKKILAKGLKYLIIKKGSNGALLFSNDGRIFSAPALILDTVVDPTGAGDSFAGGFTGYIASKGKTDFETVKAAVIAGSVTGSFCCEKFGTENLQQLTPNDISQRVKQFEELTKFNF